MQVKVRGRERELGISEDRLEQLRHLGRVILREPFQASAWRELLYFIATGALTAVGLAFVAATMAVGVGLFITFVGAIVMAASLRGARGFGRYHRSLARSLLGEDIPEPEPFSPRPGFFGWLQSALRDRVGWRAMAYLVLKGPLVVFGIWFSFSVWFDTFSCLTYPIWGRGATTPREFGIIRNVFSPGFFSVGAFGFFHGLFIFLTGVVLFFLAPWATRGFTYVDRWLMGILLSPDPLISRLRSLERARTQTVDASAATLRQIERDLHDGTQAQLVALAMQLGQAKEKLAADGEPDLERVRQLVDDAHRGTKEAIVELRDLVRGIHPPVLDTGLEGALATLTARSSLPTELEVNIGGRPSPAIEAIAYFCVAELLANVAQHAAASRASVSCAQLGQWIRLVVRDDGRGGARPTTVGCSSSGLAGLAERVHAVDGQFYVVSPPGGPTVVTVDLPMQPAT